MKSQQQSMPFVEAIQKHSYIDPKIGITPSTMLICISVEVDRIVRLTATEEDEWAKLETNVRSVPSLCGIQPDAYAIKKEMCKINHLPGTTGKRQFMMKATVE